MTTATSLPIPAHHEPAVRRFTATSPLGGFATVGYDSGPVIRVDRPLPLLSTGERDLWDLLAVLLGGDILDRADVCAPLGDLLTRAVVERGAA